MSYSEEKTYLSKYSQDEIVEALHSSIYSIISDAFSLAEPERNIIKKKMDILFKELHGKKVIALPTIVERELANLHYSRILAAGLKETVDISGAQASVQDWALIFNELINNTLDISPMLSSSNLGHFVGMLSAIGVGVDRKSRYLPTSVRQIANKVDYSY